MTGTIRLGTASPASKSTTAATLAQVSSIASRAAAAQIDILLLPEAYIGGYPRGTAFGCVIGDRSAEGREEFAKYFEQSVDLGDTVGDGAGAGAKWVKRLIGDDEQVRGDGTREELERIAKDSGVFIVVGCIERSGGSLYCSVVYVCPKEGIIGKRRKVMPTGAERLIWAQGSPSTLKAVSTKIRGIRVNLAAAICWENYMPLLRQTLYSQNVNLYLAPTADGREAWLGLMRTIGVEGRCFVMSSNMCVRDDKPSSNGINGHVKKTHTPVQRLRRTSIRTEDGHEIVLKPMPGVDKPEEDTNGSAAQPRRNSFVTAEGHEIVLPRKDGKNQVKKRRKSIIDENGNEIVLCCDEDGDCAPIIEEGESNDQRNEIETNRRSSVTFQEGNEFRPLGKADPKKKRRKSIIDENGNEIVLCCDEEEDNTTTTGDKPTSNGSTNAKTNSHAPNLSAFLSRGGSSIVGPFGDVLAGPQWENEDGLLYADVDFRDCIKGRLDLDAAGSYSRNDSFKFSVKGLDLDPLPY